jgi:hypothetical protein
VLGLEHDLLLALLPLDVLFVKLLCSQVFLVFDLVDTLLKLGRVLQLDHIHFLHDILLEIDVHFLNMAPEVGQLQVCKSLGQILL